MAVIVRDRDGKYKVTTNHQLVGEGTTWGMFWGLLFGVIFFVPVLGIAVGAGMGTVLKSSLSVAAQAELQDALHESAVAA